jgi:hypothetical protein
LEEGTKEKKRARKSIMVIMRKRACDEKYWRMVEQLKAERAILVLTLTYSLHHPVYSLTRSQCHFVTLTLSGALRGTIWAQPGQLWKSSRNALSL